MHSNLQFLPVELFQTWQNHPFWFRKDAENFAEIEGYWNHSWFAIFSVLDAKLWLFWRASFSFWSFSIFWEFAFIAENWFERLLLKIRYHRRLWLKFQARFVFLTQASWLWFLSVSPFPSASNSRLLTILWNQRQLSRINQFNYRNSCSACKSWFDFRTSISTTSISRLIFRTISSFSNESALYFSVMLLTFSVLIWLSCSWNSISELRSHKMYRKTYQKTLCLWT